MGQIQVKYPTKGADPNIREDLKILRDAHNLSEKILELESRTSDPTVTASTSKVYLWYRSDTNQLSLNENGTVLRVTLT